MNFEAIEDLNRFSLESNKNYAGPTTSVATTVTEATLNCTALGGATYPKRVLLHARGADMYLAQGGSTVALNATAANNLLIRAEERVELVISSADSAYFAHKRVTSDGVLAVTRTDVVA